jgi:hypothetical protein
MAMALRLTESFAVTARSGAEETALSLADRMRPRQRHFVMNRSRFLIGAGPRGLTTTVPAGADNRRIDPR